MSRKLLASLLLSVCPLAACENGAANATTALVDKDGRQIGTASFTDVGDGVSVSVEVNGATAGRHGLHVHAQGLCEGPTFMSAGDHFNPGGRQHGSPGAAEHHAGDFGNLEAMQVGADGRGTLVLMSNAIKVRAEAPESIVGKALIFHEKEDDLATQPSGNSGARIACGVIALKR